VVLIVAYMMLVDAAKALFYPAHDARLAVPAAQPAISGAQPATDPRSVRRLRRRAAPFTAHALTGPGRLLRHRSGTDGQPQASAVPGRPARR
jgi:hypothetical protein